jgi:hypothetical protein
MGRSISYLAFFEPDNADLLTDLYTKTRKQNFVLNNIKRLMLPPVIYTMACNKHDQEKRG